MRNLTGILLVILAAVCFGFMGLFFSWPRTSAGRVSVEMILFLRFAIAGVVMSVILLLRGSRVPSGSTLLGLIGMGAVLYVGESLFFFHALDHIPLGIVSLLLYVYPVVVTAFAWLFWKERLGRARLLALALAIVGLTLTIGPTILDEGQALSPHSVPALGVALGLGCCVSYAMYILVGGALTRRAGAISASTVVIISAAAAFGAIVLVRGDALPATTEAWLGVCLLAVVSTVIPITAVLFGLERIGPVQTSMLSTLEPVVTVIVGAMLMNQKLTIIQVSGGTLIVFAALIVAKTVQASPKQTMPTNVQVLEMH